MVKKKKVAVALSGGIDSSFSAYFLKQKGYYVEAFTFKIPFMPSDYIQRAQEVCKKIGIKHHIIDVEEKFSSLVVHYFIDSYLRGLTPNPCVYCNRLIKFGLLLDEAEKRGFKLFSTGHYVSIIRENKNLYLAKSKADKHSQEYFLALIPKKILKMCLFPLGCYTKSEIERRAKSFYAFKVTSSQDICFIQKNNYRDFILAHTKKDNFHYGYIRYLDGTILKQHTGIHNFTYGQREKLGISWHSPLYVVDINSKNGDVIVAEKELAFRKEFFIGNMNWFYPPKNYYNISVKLRYSSSPLDCNIKIISHSKIKCILSSKKDIPSPGQLAVLYDKRKVIAGGIIEK